MQKPSHHLSGQACSYCAGTLVKQKESLEAKFPEIAAQLDFAKNSKSPDTFTPYSSKHAWWKCDKGHSWKAKITNRTNRGSGCPFFAPNNRRAAEDNYLVITNPELTAKWGYETNNGLTPEDVTSGSLLFLGKKPLSRGFFLALSMRASGRTAAVPPVHRE